jgi:type II secretory pathway pseudopilin PulG
MLPLSRLKLIVLHKKENGFTLIEMLVVAPILLLMIGVFISGMIRITGDVLLAENASSSTYNIQSAMDRIEQDVKLSSSFLATNNVILVNGQGYDSDNGISTPFKNASNTTGTMLILHSYTTTNNPLSPVRNIVYNNTPIDCNNPLVVNNAPTMMNTIYFVKDNILWRRVVANSDYATIGCSVPWQQPSCATGVPGTLCKTEDTKLTEGVSATGGFIVKYYPNANSSAAENTIASDYTKSNSERQAALNLTKSIGVEIHATSSVTGQAINKVGTMRITRWNNIQNNSTAVITQQPISRTIVAPAGTTFSATSSFNGSPTISWLKSTDNGATWSPIAGAVLSTLTIASAGDHDNPDQSQYRAVFTNGIDTAISSPATLTVSDAVGAGGWREFGASGQPAFQNSWTNYSTTFNSAGFRMTNSGVVTLKGLIKNGTDNIIATLPEGYRPSQNLLFGVSSNANVSARVDIGADGNIYRITGSPTWLSLENIQFIPAYGRYNRTNISSFRNNWINYGGVYGNISYATDSVGRVHLQGLAVPGTITDGTPIFNLPNSIIPSKYQHVASISTGWSYFGIDTNATPAAIVAKGLGASYLSLNTMYYKNTSGWTNLSLVNGWAPFNGIYSTPQYIKGSDGIVTIKGLIQSGTANLIATLPAGYRPSNTMLCATGSWGAYSRIDIAATGTITVVAGGNSLWRSLDNISFYAG